MTFEYFCRRYREFLEEHLSHLQVTDEEIIKMYVAIYVLEEDRAKRELTERKFKSAN